MAKYTYKQENNKYVVYKDGKPLRTHMVSL